MTLPQFTSDLSDVIEKELTGIIKSRDVPLYDMMAYHMGWQSAPGLDDSPIPQQRTRGVLCLLACRALGGDYSSAIPAAAAVELVHSFTEVHDDVQGGQPQRDGRDALWWVWGPAQAINAGDGLHALARLALFQLLDRGASPELVFRAVQLMDKTSLEVCEGRFMDLEAQERIDLSVESYMKMARSKTGALFACAMQLGALIGGGDEEAVESLGRCGYELGLAIQIREDIVALWGNGSEEYVPSTEVMNKKKLFPAVYAVENAKVSDKRRMGEIYFKRVLDPDDVMALRQVIEELGAKDAAERALRHHADEALSALEESSIGAEGKGPLAETINSLLG
ncbi:MAG: polyprenyl synthetase family protein [Chloroflexi bacterium]|nr:polyprenyl synthetase family protein [Chloroflexota bacterium]